MLKKILTVVGVLAVFAGLSYASAQDSPQSPIGAKRVIWLASDGFGGQYVNWDELPNLRKMRDAGAWTLHMRSVLPSSSAICWETQMVGAPSESHGYRDWGSQKPDLPPVYLNEHGRFPDIFRVLKDQIPDCSCKVVYGWDGIGFLFDKEAVDADVFLPREPDVCAKGLEYLETKPTLSFIYFHEPDGIGHGKGWGSPEYQNVMTQIDGYIGQLLDYIEAQGMLDDTLVIFTSDHGGTPEKTHGGDTMNCMEVPFLFYGKGVKQGEITDVCVHYDVAATIAWALGAKAPQCWRGKPVKSAFDLK